MVMPDNDTTDAPNDANSSKDTKRVIAPLSERIAAKLGVPLTTKHGKAAAEDAK